MRKWKGWINGINGEVEGWINGINGIDGEVERVDKWGINGEVERINGINGECG